MWNPKVPGSAVAPAAVGCAPAPDFSENSTGLRPHLFPSNPRGRVLVRFPRRRLQAGGPRADALPGTLALPRRLA